MRPNSNSDSSSADERRAVDTADTARLERLRRIFLNLPTTPTCPSDDSASCDSDDPEQDHGESWQHSTPARPTEFAAPSLHVDDHLRMLREAMAQWAEHQDCERYETRRQLDHALAEVRQLQQQQERNLHQQLAALDEAYERRCETLRRQFDAKTRELHEEKAMAAQQQCALAQAALTAAATRICSQLQRQQQQHATAMFDPCPRPLVEYATPRGKSTPLRESRASPTYSRQHRVVVPCAASSMTRQRAKLHALEEKLAAFSQDTLQRATPSKCSSRDATKELPRPSVRPDLNPRPQTCLPTRDDATKWSRRYLLPEEELEYRTLQRQIHIAQGWMAADEDDSI